MCLNNSSSGTSFPSHRDGEYVDNSEHDAEEEVINCFSDEYSCDDFDGQDNAQSVYSYCLDDVGYDVHRIDINGDGQACNL